LPSRIKLHCCCSMSPCKGNRHLTTMDLHIIQQTRKHTTICLQLLLLLTADLRSTVNTHTHTLYPTHLLLLVLLTADLHYTVSTHIHTRTHPTTYLPLLLLLLQTAGFHYTINTHIHTRTHYTPAAAAAAAASDR